MTAISRQTAVKVMYWNAVIAITVVGLAAASVVRRIHVYDTLIVDISRSRHLDPRLVSAVIWKESKFNVSAVGEKGEVGLMQVTMPAGREWAEAEGHTSFSKRDLFDPRVNLHAGTWYLARAISRWSAYPDPLPYALAEYNAGHTNAKRWAEAADADAGDFLNAVTFGTTRKYIEDILGRYRGGV